MKLPHPIPYQGSKRGLAPQIAQYLPEHVSTWYEPFVGSGAMTILAAHKRIAKHYVIGDVLPPIVELWNVILKQPHETTRYYAEVWQGQESAGSDYFNTVRARYNLERNPIDLLYLICRCVKNAIRFNSKTGNFTQSVDKRRLGMHPDRMSDAIIGVSQMLAGKTEVRTGDWLDTTSDATHRDFIYMDPPYMGTSIGKDKRYAEQMLPERLIGGLEQVLARKVPFALSYDGTTGGREYGPPLPATLGLTRLMLHAGKSSQATLVGKSEVTLESLYLSPHLDVPQAPAEEEKPLQASFAI